MENFTGWMARGSENENGTVPFYLKRKTTNSARFHELKKRLKREDEDENQKIKEKAEARLYTIIKVVRDEDLEEQIGKDIFFDLVNPDIVRSFRVKKQTSFNVFKEEVAKVFGIPAQFQRFWLWLKRQNHTFRPWRPLTQIEEAGPVGQFKRVKNVKETELRLFLEVERDPALYPIAPLEKNEDDILLFFKLYDPEEEELRYVGSLLVNPTDTPSEILTTLNEFAGFDPDEEIQIYEEIKFNPNVVCVSVDKEVTFQESELENGDIICFQKASAIATEKHIRYPDVPSYLEYVHNCYPDATSSLEYVHNCKVFLGPSDTESEDEEALEEENENIMAEETNVDKNTEAQHSKVDTDTSKANASKPVSKGSTSEFVSKDFEEIDAMIDEDVIAAIDRVLSEGITLSLKSQHSVQGREVQKLDPNLSEQLLQELRDIAFKEDLVKKLREGLNPKVNFNAVKEKIYANADAFSSHRLEQVGTVVNLLNNIVRVFEKLENLKKERDSAKKSIDQDIEALKETRQKILTSKISFTNYQIQLNSLDAELADFTAKLEKLKGDRTKIVEMQDQEKRKISSLNKEVKLIFRRLVDDQIKLKSVEDQILEAQTELESHEKLYRIFKAAPPF
ncbi:ubiquitin carboxyl-terminal hydrolase [Trifolium repens]|nr:ubiquitin carboxyl-terminal hydrolase [Trifolium repens]